MKVYVFVFERDHEGQDLQGVYSTPEKAFEAVDKYPKRAQRDAAVYAVEVDAEASAHIIVGELIER